MWRGERCYQGPLIFVILLFLSNVLLAFCDSSQTEVSPGSMVPQQFSAPCCQVEKQHTFAYLGKENMPSML